MDRLGRLRLWLVGVGVLVWVPYLVSKYGIGRHVPVGWVLVVHVPCMVGALCLRIWEWRRRRA